MPRQLDSPKRRMLEKRDRVHRGPSPGSGQKVGASALAVPSIPLPEGVAPAWRQRRPRVRMLAIRAASVTALLRRGRFHRPKSVNGAGLLGSGTGQAAGGKNLRRPLFQRRPSGRRRMAPIGFRPLPCRPGLLGAEVLVGVVHQGIEPALGSCRGESVSGDPLLQRFPNGKIVLLFPALALQEPGAPRLQFGPYDLWKLLCGFSNDPHPQNDHVPFRESRCALCQLPPRHQEGPLQCFLLSVAPYVENEVCGVSFRHPRLVSGGGRLDCWSKLFYCTNSSASAEGSNRQRIVAGMTSPLVEVGTSGQDNRRTDVRVINEV